MSVIDEAKAKIKGRALKLVMPEGDDARIAAAAEPFGKIDALFNNAGITKFAPNHGDLDAVDADDAPTTTHAHAARAIRSTW